jgi:protein-tyrosine phosphatase
MLPPFVDLHCHLLAGLDDGPATEEEALAMCRLAYAEGTRMVAATAHQNDRYPAVTPDCIRDSCGRLSQVLKGAGLPLLAFPCAEVMVHAEIETAWEAGALLSVADRRKYLLLEMPHGLFVDLGETVRGLVARGVRPILAHPERQEEFLHEPGRIEHLIAEGCLVQVSSGSVTRPRSRADAGALRGWFRRGIVHCLGSDGHSPTARPPEMAAAYQQVRRWAGSAVADRVCSTFGMAILQGLPIQVPRPEPRRRSWLASWLR